MLRESERIRHWLWYERKEGVRDDNKAGRLIARLSDLRRTTPLDRDHAKRDLNDAGLYRR